MRMNKRLQKFLFAVPVILLVLTTLLGCTSVARQENTPPTNTVGKEATLTFQEFLWSENSAILMVQIGLMVAGSIGVFALLPSPDEEPE